MPADGAGQPRRPPDADPAGAQRGDETARAAAHLDAIAAAPRPAGSEAEARARAYCARVLAAAGFAVREERFEYSSAVGRFATPIAGVLAAVVLCTSAWAGATGRAGLALATLVLTAVGLAAGARWAARDGVLRLPVARRTATNLVATHGAEWPSVWLVAHVDSKSQPVPIAVRAAGIVVTALVWIGAAGLAAAQQGGAVAADGSRGAWLAVAVLGVVGAVPVMASVVQARSPGALDNASGVAAVLLAAELLAVEARRAGPHGVLVTSAEELGLAGARAWARAWRASGRAAGVAVNCDGVDDAGALTCMYTGAAPRELVAALGRAAHGVRVRRLVPGILVDAVALADAGWETLTVSKGTVRTLARIHTPADTRGALTGRGVAEAAAVMRAAVAVIAARRARPAGAGGRRG